MSDPHEKSFFQREFERGDPDKVVAEMSRRIIELVDADDRLMEHLLVTGLDWREASCLATEELLGEYTRAGRFQLARDLRKVRHG